MRRILLSLFALLAALVGAAAQAHELSMAEMEVRQLTQREFVWVWTATATRNGGQELRVQWPEGCVAQENLLRCGPDGLNGRIAVDGVGTRFSAAMIRVYWMDGETRVYTVTSAQPSVQVYGSADDRRGAGQILWAYTVLGVEHILGGIDHLLFVMSLLFLVGFNRRLFWTITAFTVAHSLTLGLSALGWIVLRSPPVEATIALSIVLVAGEALHRRRTLARQWPALVAFLFGLAHGLGFAGALKEIGLPDQHLLLALLAFNGGVEIGQLMVVGVAYVAYRLLTGRPHLVLARTAALYAIGTIAAYWSWSRIAQLLA